MTLSPGIDKKMFIESVLGEIEHKSYVIQIGGLQTLGFFPEECTPESSLYSVFVSDKWAIEEWKIFLLKHKWAIRFGNNYIIEDVFPFLSPKGEISGFGIKVNGIYRLYIRDAHMDINLQVQQILNWACPEWNFDNRADLEDAMKFNFFSWVFYS